MLFRSIDVLGHGMCACGVLACPRAGGAGGSDPQGDGAFDEGGQEEKEA